MYQKKAFAESKKVVHYVAMSDQITKEGKAYFPGHSPSPPGGVVVVLFLWSLVSYDVSSEDALRSLVLGLVFRLIFWLVFGLMHCARQTS